MSFGLFMKLIAVGAALLMLLFLFPPTKAAVDDLVEAWTITLPPAMVSVLAGLPLLLLGAVLVGLTWWLFGRTE